MAHAWAAAHACAVETSEQMLCGAPRHMPGHMRARPHIAYLLAIYLACLQTVGNAQGGSTEALREDAGNFASGCGFARLGARVWFSR
jgi:hypothetical protein